MAEAQPAGKIEWMKQYKEGQAEAVVGSPASGATYLSHPHAPDPEVIVTTIMSLSLQLLLHSCSHVASRSPKALPRGCFRQDQVCLSSVITGWTERRLEETCKNLRVASASQPSCCQITAPSSPLHCECPWVGREPMFNGQILWEGGNIVWPCWG